MTLNHIDCKISINIEISSFFPSKKLVQPTIKVLFNFDVTILISNAKPL